MPNNISDPQWKALLAYEAVKPRALEILETRHSELVARYRRMHGYGGAGALNGPFCKNEGEWIEQGIRWMAIEIARNEVVAAHAGPAT
jgi:hypothetical protein